MIDPIDSVSLVMQVLRREMATNLTRMRRAGELPAASESADGAAAVSANRMAALEGTLRRRLGALTREDFARREAVAMVFVESVLLAEFGAQGMNDAGFRELVQMVVEAFAGDAELAQQLDGLAAALR